VTKPADAIRVLIVDDSAVIRGALGRIVDAEPDMMVATTAPNGRVALDALKHMPIDVVLLDIEMPELDGLSALPKILSQYPATRVIMASSLTQSGAEVTMQALALGAADYIAKPAAKSGSATLASLAIEIASKVRAIGRAARGNPAPRVIRPMVRSAATGRPTPTAALLAVTGDGAIPRVLAVASSTGGPNALAEMLAGLPADYPLPILITQHMPPIFTTLLAQRLMRDANRECIEASDGELLRPGCTYVARGDYHMTVQTLEGQPFLRLTQSAPENYCRPAADPMLRSVASIYGASTLAVVLTGMGEDGRRGCEEVHRRGGRVIVQDEATSVVWGMPGAVANAGLANWVLPLHDIAAQVTSLSQVAVS